MKMQLDNGYKMVSVYLHNNDKSDGDEKEYAKVMFQVEMLIADDLMSPIFVPEYLCRKVELEDEYYYKGRPVYARGRGCAATWEKKAEEINATAIKSSFIPDAYSDAYTLLRKCRDDLMQYLFVLNVIQNKHGLTDEEAEKFNINSESMMKMIELDVSILVSGERKTDAELAMEKWIYNVLESSENKEDRKQFFDTSKYKSYLVSNNEKVNIFLIIFL